MKKKLFYGILACATLLSFAACNKDDDPEVSVTQIPTVTKCEVYFHTKATPLTYSLGLVNITVNYCGNANVADTSYLQAYAEGTLAQHQVAETEWTSGTFSNLKQVAGYRYAATLDTTNAMYKQLVVLAADTSKREILSQMVQQLGKQLVDPTNGLYFTIEMVEKLTYNNGLTKQYSLGKKVVDCRGMNAEDTENLLMRLSGILVPSYYATKCPGTGARLYGFWGGLF